MKLDEGVPRVILRCTTRKNPTRFDREPRFYAVESEVDLGIIT